MASSAGRTHIGAVVVLTVPACRNVLPGFVWGTARVLAGLAFPALYYYNHLKHLKYL